MKVLRAGLIGAWWGMLAWQAYAVAEYAFTTLVPQVRYGMSLAAWHGKLSLVLLVFYTASGLVTGAILGIAAGPWDAMPLKENRRYQTVGTLTLVLAFAGNLANGGSRWPGLAAACALAGVLVWTLFSVSWANRFAWLASPWCAAPFLLAAGWADKEGFPQRNAVLRFVVIAIIAALFAALSFLGSRFRDARRPPSPAWQGSLVLGGALLVWGCGQWLDSRIHVEAASTPSAARGSSRPNVLLVTMDTVRADHLSLYGYARNTTPNLVKLAQAATVVSHPVAASNGTLISHAAIFTGVYGSWNGARSNDVVQVPISPKFPMLAEVLRDQGYSTAAIVANSAYLIPAFGFNRGFQVFDSRNPLRVVSQGKTYCLRFGARKILDHVMDTTDFDLMFLRAEEINRLAFRFLDRAPAENQPFFLFLNYMDAHSPYRPPKPFSSLFPVDEGRAPLSIDLQHVVSRLVSQYDGGIAYIDAQVGELIVRLKQLGLYDNTLIIITSDHGEAFGEQGYYEHGATVYESVVYVPLLIKYPGKTEGRRLDRPAGHVDILPTVMEVTAATPPRFIQGHSLTGDDAGPTRILFSEAFPSPPDHGRRRDFTERALYSGTFKYVGSTEGERALFDLSGDPTAVHDICGLDATRCLEMQRQLAAWTSGIPAHSVSGTKLDSKTQELLKSLGYLGH